MLALEVMILQHKTKPRALCLAKNIHILVNVITFALNTMQALHRPWKINCCMNTTS